MTSVKKTNGFIRIEHDLIRSAAWQSLHVCAMALLIDVWSRHNGKNNGQIPYSCSEARRRFGWGQTQIVRWFRELETQGFLVPTSRGHFKII
jgi:hypothetical protein